MMNATPSKLRDGSWGARVQGQASPGDVVQISTKAGKSWQARVVRVVWSGDGVTLCATGPIGSSGPSRRTGCSCGSREDADGDLIDSENNCATCEYDR